MWSLNKQLENNIIASIKAAKKLNLACHIQAMHDTKALCVDCKNSQIFIFLNKKWFMIF